MIQKKIDSISTKEDFVEFLSALQCDLLGHPDEWENPTLERFLHAIEPWVSVIDVCAENIGNKGLVKPSWKTFSEILYAAKMYE